MDKVKNVLICEDDSIQRKTLVAAFRQAGFKTLEARSPGEALREVGIIGIDVVVSDVQLEQGNAFDLIQGLRRAGKDAPVLLTSGFGTQGMRDRAVAAGAAGFREKPFSLHEVVRDAKRLIEETAPRPVGARILVVDDHAQTRAQLAGVLAHAGLETVVAKDGQEALAALARSTFDMVLSDLHLPGVRGTELIRSMRKAVPGIYVAMMTGEAGHAEIEAGYRDGASNLVRKPVSPRTLVAFVKANLSAAREMRQAAEREARLAQEPSLRRFARRFRAWRRTREGRRRLLGLGLVAASLVIGVVGAHAIQTTVAAVDQVREKADRILDAAGQGLTPPAADTALQQWYLSQKLQLDREMNQTTRRYYESQVDGTRQRGLSR